MVTILLVDDHALFRQALLKILKQASDSYLIVEASNGEEALEVIKSRHIDLVLLDIQMPAKNGLETFKEIKRLKYKTKVLILTMLNESALVIHLLKLGVNGFLSKSGEIDELENAIVKILLEGEYHNEFVVKVMDKYIQYPADFPNLNLSPREFQLLELIKQGMTNKEIASYIDLEILTIESYRKALMNKTKCRNTAELVSFAYKIGV